MKKYIGLKSVLMAVFCVCLFWSSSMDAEAAKAKVNYTCSEITFNAEYYYNTYPDLQAAFGMDPVALYQHYLAFGIKEGRFGSEEFNCVTYMNNYGDLRLAFGGDYLLYCEHYEKFGKAEGRNAKEKVEVTIAVDKTLLGTYSTVYDPSMERTINVTTAAERIHGIVLAPGQGFLLTMQYFPEPAITALG